MTPNQPLTPEKSVLPATELVPSIEQKEVLPAAPAPVEQAPAAQAVPTFTPPVQAAPDPAPAPLVNVPTASTPAIANDQDKIEKEWVETAEQVIKETANNPYLEEEAVENLQVDYLQKRYGREIKKPEGS